jgi:penicillin-binding protein 2
MTSTPAYDPNKFTTGIDPALWGHLSTDPGTPLVNRVIQGLYSPGSTFKLVMATAALQEGVITPETTFYCPGYLSVYNTIFHCARASGHGVMDVHKAIAQSCNVFFYQVGMRLEIARIAAYAKRMGLGAPTGIDLPYEAGGLIPSPEWKLRTQKSPWFGGETISVAIGQGQVNVTPLQMARLAAVVAIGGKLVRPHLVKSRGGVPLAGEPPPDLGLKPSVLQIVREGMASVVAEGTGWRARLPNVVVCGKTGSTQVVAKARLEKTPNAFSMIPHGWFVAFAPAENPRIALAVLVEHAGSGGEGAAPVAHDILAAFFGLAAPAAPGVVGVKDTETED